MEMEDVILNPDMPPERARIHEVYGCDYCSEKAGSCVCYDIDYAYKAGGYHPWEKDGYRIFGKAWTQGIESVWDKKSWAKIDLHKLIADYYLLDGIASCVVIPGAAPPKTILNAEVVVDMLNAGFYMKETGCDLESSTFEAAVAFAKLVTNYAPIVRDYMHYAIAGELSCTNDLYRSIGDFEDWDEACVSWHYMIHKFGHEKCAEWAVDAFENCHWVRGYGGSAWKAIAKVAYHYEQGVWREQRFGAREFLDRAFSLQHNNATMFDKASWATDPGDLEHLLDAHAESDWSTLYSNASAQTQTAFNNHMKACGV